MLQVGNFAKGVTNKGNMLGKKIYNSSVLMWIWLSFVRSAVIFTLLFIISVKWLSKYQA
jgi:hypothetical protein